MRARIKNVKREERESDLKAAFDSVYRASCTVEITRGDRGPSRRPGFSSSIISTTSGVRQGCLLALDLFCHAIDWLMSRLKSGGELGIRVGQKTFDDLRSTYDDYAGDAALLLSARASTAALLQRFDEEAGCRGFHVSWAKTKIHYVDHVTALPAFSVGACIVDSVSEFIYVCRKISDGNSTWPGL